MPCVPSAEVCNGRDDDCDSAVDESCPASLAWDVASKRTNLGDSQGGSEFSDTCAGDEALAGINLAVGAWVDQVQGVCRKLTLVTAPDRSPYEYSVLLGAPRTLAAHPEVSASPRQDLICSGNALLVGVRISQQSSGSPASVVVPQIWLNCAEPILKVDATPPSISWQSLSTIGPASGSYANQTAYFEEDAIKSPQILVGLQGSSGNWLDRIGVASANVAVLFRAAH